LRAALAILDRPGRSEPGWQVPEPVRLPRILVRVPQMALEASAARNEPCSCGSGLKLKHCCGGPTGAAPFATVAAPRRPQG